MLEWRQGLPARLRRALRWARSSRWDLIWVAFVVANLTVMKLVPQWGTVPFLAIWVSLTVIYGFRLWRLQPAILTLTVVTLATGAIIGIEVINGQQDADYLAEVPLIALMFLVMVWHGRRRVSAVEGRLAAMEEVQRVSQENLRLLEQQRLFLLDAAHELGTPITVALGHAELIERAVTDQLVAMDALVENAVAHTEADDLIELSAWVEGGQAVLAVTDSGCGIPEEDLARIFSRFSRATPYRSRESGGFGLGLPVVAAIAEAHHGSVRVTSRVGSGSTFELVVPTTGETANGSEPSTVRSGKSSLSRTYGCDSRAHYHRPPKCGPPR